MRRTLLLSVLLTALCAPGAFAQIEVGQDGSVGVRSGPLSYSGFYVRCNEDCGRSGSSFTYGYGAYANSFGKSRNRGIYGRASAGSGNPNSIVLNYGVLGRADGEATYNYGVMGQAMGASDVGYGIYGYVTGAATRYAGYFSGDVHVTGTLTEASDAMFKRHVEPLGGGESGPSTFAMRQSSPGEGPPRSQARAKLLQLRPVKYHYRRGAYDQMGFPEGEHFGFLAQEVEAVLPELVTESVHPGAEEIGEDGEPTRTGEPLRYKSVNYLGLVPMLVQTAKEQQAEIDALRAEVQALQESAKDDED